MEETDTTWRGKVGGMSEDEVKAFLHRGKMMRVACLKEDGSPYITVCWHDWHDGYFWLVPRQRSRWAQLLENDGRLAFVVDDEASLQKVTGDGVAEVVERPNVGGQWVEVATRMSYRYLGENDSNVPDVDDESAALALSLQAVQRQDVAGSRLGQALLG